MAKDEEEVPPIIVRKTVKKAGGGHHGGAWKVAYADFTTAMMAFFMLLWLLNVSDKETLDGLADYFTPTRASIATDTGAGRILGGTSPTSEGAQDSGAVAIQMPGSPASSEVSPDAIQPGKANTGEGNARGGYASTVNTQSDPALMAAADRLRQIMQEVPEMADHQDQLIVEQTQEGMRIQLFDKDRRPMFEAATDQMYGYAEDMIAEIGRVVSNLPNRISIHGHTDGRPYNGPGGYSNWELSADRANTARRVLSASGVSQDRFSEVVGKAASEPMVPDDPLRAENRRITILVLREAPVVSPTFGGN